MRPLERCSLCGLVTNRAGAHEDSNSCPITEKGPYCDECHKARNEGMVEALRWVKWGVILDPMDEEIIDAKLAELEGE